MHFEQAIEHDPTYVLAYVGLADTYILLARADFLPPKEAFPKAKAAALKALQFDPKLSETVTITAQAPLVDTRTSFQGMLIDDARIKELPRNGRNTIDLVALAPGVTNINTVIKSDFSQQRVRIGTIEESGSAHRFGVGHFRRWAHELARELRHFV